MSKFSINKFQRNAQSGFTLIELVVVMVILGILAATALPKFADLGADARVAKLNAGRAAVISASAMYHSRWLANGSPSAGGTYDTIDVNTTGFPTATSIVTAAGGLADYSVSGASIRVDASHTSCAFTYTPGDGTVSAMPASTECD